MSSTKSGKRLNRRDIGKVINEATSDDNDIYTVESILDKKKENGNWKYLIKWHGWSKSQATWEPLGNLDNIKETLERFDKIWEENNKNKKDKENEEENESEIEKSGEKLKSKSSIKEKKIQIEDNLDKKVSKTTEKKQPNGETETLIVNKKSEIQKSVGRKRAEHTFNSNKKVKISKTLDEESISKITQPLHGHFKYGDKAKKIISARSEEPYVICTIDWEIRPEGTLPLRTNLTNKEIKQYDPLLLLEFYESRLKFGSNGNGSTKQNDHQDRSAIVNIGKNKTQTNGNTIPKRSLPKNNKAEMQLIQEEIDEKVDFIKDERKNNVQRAPSQSSRKQSKDDVLIEKTLEYSNAKGLKSNDEQSAEDFDQRGDENDNERHNLGFEMISNIAIVEEY